MSDYFKSCYSEKMINGIKTRLFKNDETGEVVFSDELNNMFNYSDEEFKQIFNGKSKLALRKDMHRWKDDTFKEPIKMKGTLKNLEMLCFIANCEPNDILLDGVTSKEITANTSYLSLDALRKICNSIVVTYNEINEKAANEEDGEYLYFDAKNEFLSDPLLIPIEFSPATLRFLFLKIYKENDVDKNRIDIKMQFVMNEYNKFSEGLVPTEDEKVIFNLTSPSENKKLTLDKFYHEKSVLLTNKDERDLYTEYITGIDDHLKKILTEEKCGDFFFQLYYDEIKESEDN